MELKDSEINNLRENIKKIVSLHENLKADNDAIKATNKSFLKQIEVLSHEKKEIENQFQKLKLAKSIELSSKDKYDSKMKINKIVREIDDCIALMNK